MSKFYDWQKTMSYQTGNNGEVCLVLGAKDIGKTYGLRKKCIERFIKRPEELFCELCRTENELKVVAPNYFSKVGEEFPNYIFKTEKKCGYIAKRPAEGSKPDWQLLCYFVSLSSFQQEKKRTFVKPKRFIFDEAVIDTKDRYHRYLPEEFFILMNLLDSISRQQPGDGYQYYVYLLGNAVDLTCPYLRYLGISKLPDFGYSYYKNKSVLLHYVEPWDAEDKRAYTLVGRMLAGHDESRIIFDNEFEDTTGREIAKKSSNAKYRFALSWGKMKFAVWVDMKRGIWYITSKFPKGAVNVYTLAKRDSTLNYQVIDRASPLMTTLVKIYYIGGLRYESAHLREAFFEILTFLGVR